MATVITLHPYAKINLYLKVLDKRKDNFHNLVTLFERIDLRDTIALRCRRDKLIKVSCAAPGVPRDNSNLCARSAQLLQDRFRLPCGFDIRITKRIPVGAGLGGGSADAAAVLSGINKLCGLKLPLKKLADLGQEIGSDVPFFLYQAPFAEARGRGELIRPLAGLKKTRLWHILVVPRVHVSTPLIYRWWDELTAQKGQLTSPKYGVKILNLALRKRRFPLKPEIFFNSLEEVTCRFYPEVRRVKAALAKIGVKIILMSGSGPAVFGVAASRKEAVAFRRKLNQLGHNWRVFAVKTV